MGLSFVEFKKKMPKPNIIYMMDRLMNNKDTIILYSKLSVRGVWNYCIQERQKQQQWRNKSFHLVSLF